MTGTLYYFETWNIDRKINEAYQLFELTNNTGVLFGAVLH